MTTSDSPLTVRAMGSLVSLTCWMSFLALRVKVVTLWILEGRIMILHDEFHVQFVTLFDVEGRFEDAFFGDDGSDEVTGGDIEGGVVDGTVVGGDLEMFGVGEFRWVSFFDRDEVAVGKVWIES